jgi:TolB-like protein
MTRPSFFAELKRRNVIRAAVLYVGAVWALAQGIAQLGPAFGMPEWGTRWFVIASAIGFPFWVAFAWFYEFTPEGLKRESEVDPADSMTAHTGRKLDRWIFAVMGVAIVLLLTNTFVWKKGAGLAPEPEHLPAPEKSIAVLPFVDMSQSKDQEYFSDGISEELLNVLAGIPSLQVTARTSSFSFKGKDVTIPEIAKTLRVAHILEGSVRKSGNQVRVTAQLIHAANDKHLWSQTYDRKLDDVFAIQDEIAADVVKALKVTLLGDVPKARATNPEAYALFLQGNDVGRTGTPEAFAASDALYRRALEIDPKYVPAWDGLTRNAINRRSTRPSWPSSFGSKRVAPPTRLWRSIRIMRERMGGSVRSPCTAAIYRVAVQHFQHALALDPGDTVVLGNRGLAAQQARAR